MGISIHKYHNGILINNLDNYDLNKLNFLRYTITESNNRIYIVKNKVIQLGFLNPNSLYIDNVNTDDFKDWLVDFLKAKYINIVECIVCNYITQDLESPRNSTRMENLCKEFGTKIEYKGSVFYSFPNIEILDGIDIDTWRRLGVGYWSSGISLIISQLVRLEKEVGDLNKYFKNMEKEDLYKFFEDKYGFKSYTIKRIVESI